jgi:hypothetical protein
MADEIDTLTEQILFDDAKALENLAAFAASLTTTQEKITGLQALVDSLAEKMGEGFGAALNKVQEVNAQLQQMTEQGTGGGFGAAVGFNPETFDAVEESAVNVDAAFQKDLQDLEEMRTVGAPAVAEVSNEMQNATETSNELAGTVNKVGSALQVAFGLTIYRLVRDVIDLFRTGIDYGIQWAQSIFLVNSAVDQMRSSGVDVTFKDLRDIVIDLSSRLKTFSQLDLSKAVAEVAALGGQFGMTAQQVSDLTEFSAVAVERFGGNITDVTKQITSAMLNMTQAQARRVLDLTGVQMSAVEIYNEAVQLGIDNGAKSYQQLTDQTKVLAGITLLEEHLADLRKNEAAFIDSEPGKLDTLGAKWKNLWTSIGNVASPLLSWLADAGNTLIDIYIKVASVMTATSDVVAGFFTGQFKNVDELAKKWEDIYNNMVKTFTNPMASGLNQPALAVPLSSVGVPPTETNVADAQKRADDIVKIQADMKDEVIRTQDEMVAKSEQIDEDYSRKLEDAALKRTRALEDLEIDKANKVADIQAQAAEDVAKDQQKNRDADLEAEKKYQLAMQELQENFILSLEDALHERDARAILRLIDHYNLEKKQTTDKYNLDTELRHKADAEEIAAVQKQAADKMAALDRDIAQRRAKIEEQYQQDKVDAATWKTRQMEDLAKDTADRLKQWADLLQAQYDLTDTEIKKIYNNMKDYFGPNGYVDQLYTYLLAKLAAVSGALSGLGASAGPGHSFGGGANFGFASGGTLFADTPKTVTFGEAGPEVAMFIPLRGPSTNIPSPSFNVGGAQGSLQLQLLLDPDLQARIVQTSLANVALTIDRVQRQQK